MLQLQFFGITNLKTVTTVAYPSMFYFILCGHSNYDDASNEGLRDKLTQGEQSKNLCVLKTYLLKAIAATVSPGGEPHTKYFRNVFFYTEI